MHMGASARERTDGKVGNGLVPRVAGDGGFVFDAPSL